MFLQKIVSALMALLVFAIPLGSGRYSFNIDLGPIGLMSLVGILAFGFALAHLLFGHRLLGKAKMPMDLSVTMFGLFVALNFASVGWAKIPEVAISSSVGYLQLLIFVWLLLFLRSDRRAFGILLHAFFTGSFLVLLISLYDIRSIGLAALEGRRYEGFDIHTNILALKLALGVVAAFYLFQRSNFVLRWLYISYIPGAVFLLVLTGSRTGLVVMTFALMIGLWSMLKVDQKGKDRFSIRLILMPLAFLIVMALVLATTTSDQLRFQTERIATVTQDKTAGGRVRLWARTAQVYLDQPILGVGSGGSRYAMRDHLGHDGLIVSFVTGAHAPHNTYLGIAADTGTVGAVLFLVFVLLLLARMTYFRRPERLLFLSFMGVALISGFSLSLEQNREFYFALTLSMAMAASRPHREPIRSGGLRCGQRGSGAEFSAVAARSVLSRGGMTRHQS